MNATLRSGLQLSREPDELIAGIAAKRPVEDLEGPASKRPTNHASSNFPCGQIPACSGSRGNSDRSFRPAPRRGGCHPMKVLRRSGAVGGPVIQNVVHCRTMPKTRHSRLV
jgi:hypothetical protein